jgi:hypothetical protein
MEEHIFTVSWEEFLGKRGKMRVSSIFELGRFGHDDDHEHEHHHKDHHEDHHEDHHKGHRDSCRDH